ncbi:IclR family transcriptional regulator [Nonomuraea sp. NPDC004297]
MPERPRGVTIQSVDRALTILETLAESSGEVTLSAVAARLGLSASTCHHLLATLVARGYATQNPQTRAYTLGVAAKRLGRPTADQLNLAQLAAPAMRAIHERSRETVVLAVLHGTELALVSSMESPHPIRAGYGWGELSNAAHATAAGKAILAWIPEQKIAGVLDDKGLTRFTPLTVTSRTELIESLRLVRRNDLAVERDEFAEGLSSAAVAIRTEDGTVVGSLGCCMPSQRADEERMAALRSMLGEGVRTIARAYAGAV